MTNAQNTNLDEKDILGGPRRVRTSDPDVFSNPDSARIAARNLGCIGIRRYLNRSGGESWMPCSNESDYRKYSGIGVSGRRFRRQQLEQDIRQITGRGKLAKKTLEDAVEIKSSKKGNYTKPELRERLKQRIMAGSKGGAPGQWSARKAQMLAQAYKKAGGGYKTGGKTKTQRSLSSWTKQKWTTSDGKKARRGSYTRRYLPAKAWSKLTPAQRAATNRKKIQGSRSGEQFVDNTAAARAARKRSVRGVKHIEFYDGIEIKVVDGLIEEKAISRRSSRRTLQTPGALRPRLNAAGQDMNPATARDEDLDGLVLEGIPTINRGRGVIDPTPGGKPSRWVPRMRPQRAEAPAPKAKPETKPEPRRQLLRERVAKPQVEKVRESKLSWLPEDADKWTEEDAQRLLDTQKSSGLSYGEFAKQNGLFTDDVRESIEKQKSRRKSRVGAFRKNNPKLFSVVNGLGAVKDEALEAISRGKVNNWSSLVSWAFKDPELKRQRLNDRAINDLFNNVSNGLDPDGKSDTVLGFVPSRTRQGEMTKTFARANNLPDGFVSRYQTPRAAIQPARSITSAAERAARRGERRVGRISRDIQATARAFERFDSASGRMGAISGRMATPSGPDSQWTNQQKAQWKAGQWRRRFLFDEALSTARVNMSPEMQAHIAKYPDAAAAARAILDLNDQDVDKLFKGHNDALKTANITIKPPRKDELPLLPSEVAAAAQIKRPLVRSFLDEYKKMAPNGTLSRLDVDTLSNEDIEELFNRYILPEMVDPTKLDAAGVIDVAQRISQPGQENSPLRLLDNLAYMAGDDAMSLEARRRVLEEKLAAGLAQGTMTPAQQQATQNALDAIDEELAKLVADYQAGAPLTSSIPLQPLDDPRQMPRWAGGRRALSFEDPVTADDYIMFLLENEDIGFHPEWGPITKPEWENWSEDIQERAQEAERVYREGGELEAKDALDALSAEYQLWTQVGLEAGWISEPEEDDEIEELEPPRPMRDEFGVLDEDWVWNTEHGSPEELGVTDDPATWAQHPDNVEDDGVTLIPLDELQDLILKYAPRQFQADLLEILKPSEWTDPHNGHIDQRYIDLPAELIDYFVGQAMGDMPPTPSSSRGQMPTPNLGGIQGDGVGLSDPGGPRLRRGIPFIPRNINWDSALRMFQRILSKQGKQASSKGSYATASRQYDPALGVYDDWGALQLQNQFVEAAKAARELYVTGTGQDSRKAREQVWNLLQAGRTPQEISHELIIFGADQPDTNSPPQPMDLRDLVKAAATQYAVDNNIKTSEVTKLLNAADQAFSNDTARQEAFRRSQLERLRDDLTRIFSGQSPQQIIDAIEGLVEETERKKWFADQAYRIERGHDARLRKAALDLAESYPVPTARRAIFMEPDGTITDTPSRRAKTLYQEPYTGEVTDDASKGWPQAFDEGYDPTKITRARHANRIYRWWRQNWGYIERDDEGEIIREYVGPLQGTLKAHQLHARKYGNDGLAGTTAYATRTADARIRQLREVERSIREARQEARGMGISGFMRSGGPNLYEDYSRKAARVLVSGRRQNKPSSMLLGYDSDDMPVTRAMRRAFSGGSGKFLSASNEHSFAALMNPENVDYFKHLTPVEKDYFRALYSNPEFIVSVPRDIAAPARVRTRGVDSVSPDEALINAFRASMDATRPNISGQMGLQRSLNNAKKIARLNPERWQRQYLTARNSFRMRTPFSSKKKQNYSLEIVEQSDSVFKPTKGLYLIDKDTGNVIDGPFKSDELALMVSEQPSGLTAYEKAKGAKKRVIEQNYPRPWEQMPEIQELFAYGVGQEMRDFMTLDSHKLSDIRSTVYDTNTGMINERALNLDKGVPQKASDTAIFSRDPDTGELMVLLIQRAFGPHKDETGAWVLPGGFADPGETALETALRELEEEVGLKVGPSSARVKQIGTIAAPDWDVRFTKGVEVSGTALFVSPDAAFRAGDDALRAQWFSVRDIADGKVPIGFGHVAWIKNGMALEVDDPNMYGPEYESLLKGLDRIERATRARNKELIEISNSWRKELNRDRAKGDKIKLFDEKNLGPYEAWQLQPSDDMMRLGSIARMRLAGREVTPESVEADLERTRQNRLSMVDSNFGPSIVGQMGSDTDRNIRDMHMKGMSANEIKNQLRQQNGLSDDNISRSILYSGLKLAKTSDAISDEEMEIHNAVTFGDKTISEVARKNKISSSKAMEIVEKVGNSIANREPILNSALRKAVKDDKKLSGVEREALRRRLSGASRDSVAKFMGLSPEKFGKMEASLIEALKERNPNAFRSPGAWSSNPDSLFADQQIFMQYVHDGHTLARIAQNTGMTEKMAQNIVNRYARWKDSNAPLERAALKQAIARFGSVLTPGETQMLRRLSDAESIFQFAERTNMPKKAAMRMYSSAMRKMHMESGVTPKSRIFDANIYNAIPKEWISPSFLFEKAPQRSSRAISAKMSNLAKDSNQFNTQNRSYLTASLADLRQQAKDIREEMRGQIQNLSSASALMHPVFGGQEGIEKMAALGAYIKRSINEAAVNAVVEAARTSGSRFSGDREQIAKQAMNKARVSLMQELWMKRDMLDFSVDMHDMIESASWPWKKWDSDSPEWQRHANLQELIDTYNAETPKGRRAYMNAGFYMPLSDDEMIEFANAVDERNGISGRMTSRPDDTPGEDDGGGISPPDGPTIPPGPNPSNLGLPSGDNDRGVMSSSFPPLDDSVRQRLGLQNLPSSYDQAELTKQYPKITFDAYKPSPGEPSITVTTTFGGKADISKYRYDNVYRPIIDAMVARVQRPTGGKRKFVSVGGPAGSGKTTDRKTGAHNIPTPDFALHVDADEIKTLLPEARALHAAGNPLWANAVHEESRIIADLALQEAISQGLDVVYDSTGQYNSGFQTLQAARTAGYDIVMHYNTATPDALAESLERRSLTDPRSLPGHFNSAVMSRNRQIMPNVAKAADEFYLWDSTDISSRRLLASKQSASSPLEVKHEDAYVYADFDETGQKVKRGGRPTARLFQNRYAAESPEGKAIDSFDAGQSIEDIAASSGMPKDRIFNVVTTGVIDPNMQYRPPVQPSSKPLISPEKKIDDFVSDDALESTWNSLSPAQQSIVRDVLNKAPGAMDAFENENLPMDIIIWAAQNGGISGKMSSAGIRQSANNQVISDRERSAAQKARELIANNGKYSEIKRAIKEAFTGTIFGTRDYVDRTLTNRGNEFDVVISDVKVTDTGDGDYDRNGYPIPANKTRIEISGQVLPKNLGTSAKRNNNKDSLASFERVLYFGKDTAEAEHKGMVVKRQQQGIGIGTALNARNEEIYKELGISEISLLGDNYGAEGLYGADHWARNGYYWYDEDEKNKFLKKLSESVDELFRGRLDDSERKTRDEIKALIKRSRKDKFGEGVTPEELLAWANDGVTLPDNTRIRYRRVLEPQSISGNMGNQISGRITQPAEGWDDFNWTRRDIKNAPTFRGKPWRDVVPTLNGMPWPFETQKRQYPPTGEPGLSYFRGEFPDRPREWVDCLLWRDENGELVGVLNHYPVDMELEKKGNFNIFIDPKAKRQGIASALVAEAIRRYNVDLRQQRYSKEGAKFINEFVRRLPENSGKKIAGSMATRYDRDRYSPEDIRNAMLDVYNRGLQVEDALEALRNEYDILMDRTDWSTRLSRLRKAGMLDSYRLPNKKQTARKIKKSLTQKFIDKREKEVARLLSATPPLSAKEIAARVNRMPIPSGVNASKMTASGVTAIKMKNKKK